MLLDADHPERSLSLNQARTAIRKLVAELQHAGLQRGDCVCVHSFNDIYYPILSPVPWQSCRRRYLCWDKSQIIPTMSWHTISVSSRIMNRFMMAPTKDHMM